MYFALLITAVLVDYKTCACVASKKNVVSGKILRRETRLNLFRARDTLVA
jgi:hypothetical protein